jgi:cytochrome oxidase assembly protein ShyY1
VLRFVLTRRWLGLLLVVAIVAFACVELGLWQFRRYEGKVDDNRVIRANLAAAAAPIGQVMTTDDEPAEDDEWQRVEATGVYDPGHTVVILYRSRDGVPGVDVVVPLVTSAGPAVLVDRGWIENQSSDPVDALPPDPPSGEVTVTGWVRRNATGSSANVSDGAARAISSDEIGPTLPYPVYTGFVERVSEAPSVQTAPEPAEEPDLSTGPHFFYGVQWFFFALLAIAFWVYFAYAEYREQAGAVPRPGAQDRRVAP